MAPAFPRHWLFAFGGTLSEGTGADDEIWQCGIRGVPNATANYGDEDAILDRIAPEISAWFALGATQMSASSKLDFIKLNEIAPDGKYAGGTSHTKMLTPVAGGYGSQMPGFLSVAWSWRSTQTRGRATHGRIYPPVGLLQRNTSIITSDEQATFLAAAQNLLKIVDGRHDSGATPGMAGQIVSSFGLQRTITSIKIGNVIDVQRRRKNALVETYLTGDLG